MSSRKSRKSAVVDSDSDSGPDDRNPPQGTAKKQKTSESGSLRPNSDGEYSFELAKMRHVNVKNFKGRVLVNIRDFYLDKDTGELRPGKKGIALTAEQWSKLKQQVDDIDAAIKECS